jgi:formylglycine-generating enzyme required for sulfatase activity
VTNIDWSQANEYAAWVGGRLPTEAEWEKACRGTDDQIFPWGVEQPRPELLNYADSGLNGVAPVGSYPAGTHGLQDMAGNVWEWTADWYHEQYYQNSPEHNPSGPESGEVRTLRGGSFNNFKFDVRCAARQGYNPSGGNSHRGFRVISPGF